MRRYKPDLRFHARSGIVWDMNMNATANRKESEHRTGRHGVALFRMPARLAQSQPDREFPPAARSALSRIRSPLHHASVWTLLCALALLLTACGSLPRHSVTQVATIDSLLAGGYDGHVDLATLARDGDTGIGTYDRLDGEMVLLDGIFFRIGADGAVTRPPATTTTPFACVVEFAPDRRMPLSAGDYPSVQNSIRAALASPGSVVAVRIRGHFSRMKTRSVPAQDRPYRPLAAITASQPVFERTNVVGTLVGFLCPDTVKGFNVPGFHMHFLSDDRSTGGHVLEFNLARGTAELETCRRLEVILAAGPPPIGDHSADLESVER